MRSTLCFAIVSLVGLDGLAARAQAPVSLTVETRQVTGSEPVLVTLRVNDEGFPIRVRIESSRPEVIPLLEEQPFEVLGELSVELATVPVSEAMTVVLTPTLDGDPGQGDSVVVAPARIAAIAFPSERVAGGQPAVLDVSLSAPAGDTGFAFALASDNADVLPVPPQGFVEPGRTVASIPFFSTPVAETAPVSVNASQGSVSLDASVFVDGPGLLDLTFDRGVVSCGETITAAVRIGAPAPAPGVTVAVTLDDPALASAPAEVLVPEGAREATFRIETLPSAQDVTVYAHASLDGVDLAAGSFVVGATIAEFTLSPRAIPGGLSVVGRVSLIGLPPPGGALVELASEDASLAAVPESILVVPGATFIAFSVATSRVAEATQTTLSATYGGRTAIVAVELLPDGLIESSGASVLDFEACLRGPDQPVSSGCASVHDFEADADVDLRDFASLQIAFTSAAIPAPPSFRMDPTVSPEIVELPSYDGTPRPVAAVRDASGVQAELVENEILLTTDSADVLAAFLARWDGTLLQSYAPSDYGLEGSAQHLVRVRTELAQVSSLQGNLRRLDPSSSGIHSASSEAALDVLAVAASEAVAGLDVGINWVARTSAIRDRTTAESPSGPNITDSGGNNLETYRPDAGGWSYMKARGNQDIGVTEAWRALESLGRFNNRVRIAVIDRGFSVNDDWPAWRELHSVVPFSPGVNGVGDGDCGEGKPACPWHGTGTVCAAAGVPDNSYGAAGPAGPVAEMVAIRCLGDLATTPVAIGTAVLRGARIINMSFGVAVPATLSWSVLPFESVTNSVRGAGVLIFASAGNDGLDVDRESCFLACWESAWHAPCENAGVTCIGALSHHSTSRASYSNYGDEDVDLFGPGTIWTSPEPGDSMPRVTNGTSEASPFVAGVAALVLAANPALNANDVEGILLRTAHPSPDGRVKRYVDAYAAVIDALGGNEPPYIRIVSPTNGGFYAAGFLGSTLYFEADATDREDGVPQVQWSSSIDGDIGSGLYAGTGRPISFGTHVITATARDSRGAVVSTSVTMTYSDPPPRVSIREPALGASRVEGEGFVFRADTYDPDGTGFKVPDSGIRWSSSIAGAFGTGHLVPKVLSRGTHVITVTATDPGGQTATAKTTVVILNPPPNFNPPPAVSITRADAVTFFPSGVDALGVAYTDFDFEVYACDPEFTPCRPVDNDFRIGWYTNRADLQGPLLALGHAVRVRLYGDPGQAHEITVVVSDSGPLEGTATERLQIPQFKPH